MEKARGNILVIILIIVLLGLGLFGIYYLLWGRNAAVPTLPGMAPSPTVIQVKGSGEATPTVTPAPEVDPLTEIQNLDVAPDDSDLKDLNQDLQGL